MRGTVGCTHGKRKTVRQSVAVCWTKVSSFTCTYRRFGWLNLARAHREYNIRRVSLLLLSINMTAIQSKASEIKVRACEHRRRRRALSWQLTCCVNLRNAVISDWMRGNGAEAASQSRYRSARGIFMGVTPRPLVSSKTHHQRSTHLIRMPCAYSNYICPTV